LGKIVDEVVGFLGANGAGKTTTLRMILDILHPTSSSHSLNSCCRS
jgi:ABC-type multidrug transport system ATPase subunit